MRTGKVIAEVLRAFCVLGLIFLNFGHSAAVFAGDAPAVTSVITDWCGSPDHPPDHVPCHACRIGSAADLPPPPTVAMACGLVATVRYDAGLALETRRATWGLPLSRGPPALA